MIDKWMDKAERLTTGLQAEGKIMLKKPKITAKQESGDDGYCYVVRIDGVKFVEGLTRSEVPYYKQRALLFWQELNGILPTGNNPASGGQETKS